MRNGKNVLILASLFLFLILTLTVNFLAKNKKTTTTKASEISSAPSPTPEYAKGEILVKFKNQISNIKNKNNSDVTNDLDSKSLTFDSLDPQSLPPVLRDINSKYKIKNIEKVFKGAK